VRSAREAKGVWGGHSCPPPLILLFELDLRLNRVPHPSRVLCDRVGIFSYMESTRISWISLEGAPFKLRLGGGFLLPGTHTRSGTSQEGAAMFLALFARSGDFSYSESTGVPHVCVLCKRGILHSLAAYTFPCHPEYKSRDLHCATFQDAAAFNTAVTHRCDHFNGATGVLARHTKHSPLKSESRRDSRPRLSSRAKLGNAPVILMKRSPSKKDSQRKIYVFLHVQPKCHSCRDIVSALP
jgi:hypothetical protein